LPLFVSAAPTLRRDLGFLGLTATGVCSMVGASIHIMPFLVQVTVPGIGPWVLPAFAFAALPAFLAALAYAALASAMPRAGGSYLFASRGLHPSLGFVASFSQWVGLAVVIGAVAYVIPVFLSGVADGLGGAGLAGMLLAGPVRLLIALALVWGFVALNLRGLAAYERTLIPLMLVMFALGAIVIVVGAGHDATEFAAVLASRGEVVPPPMAAPFALGTFVAAAAVLFSSFIGFDAIAQAGGEARDPARTLPRAILLTFGVVAAFYLSFAAAVYHAVPWEFVAATPADTTPTASALLAPFLSPLGRAAITAGAAVALINDLPGMLLSVSRLMFAWARDGVFPVWAADVHPTTRTPRVALLASGAMATVGVLLSHAAGSFSKGVDIMVVAMLVNFLLISLALLALPRRHPALAAQMTFLAAPRARTIVGLAGVGMLSLFLMVHVRRELNTAVAVWYERPLAVWGVVMAIGTLVHLVEIRRLRAREGDLTARFATLPEE
jgi:APA family basic amino acid/polyamine antiporter